MLVPLSAREPRGPTFWVTVWLALAAAIVFLVHVREFYRWHSNPVAIVSGVIAFGSLNCVPMLLALALVLAARHSGPTMRFAGYGFSIGASGLALCGHVMWAFDIARTATGSSTAGLIFIFLPGWAVIVGAFAGVLGGSIGFAWGHRRHPVEVKRL